MKLILVVCLLFMGSAQSVTLEINPVKDNTVFQTNTISLSNGQGQYFFVGRTLMQDIEMQIRRGLIKFDVTAIPPGSTINSVSLSLEVASYRTATDVTLHVATSNWGEGASDAGSPGGAGTTAEANDATWLHAFYDHTTWNNVGGDFEVLPSGSVNVADTGPLVISSAGMVTDVQNWLDGNTTNHGWFLLGDESTNGTAVRFASRENDLTTVRPKLTIDYSPPLITAALTPVKDNTLYEDFFGGLSNGAGNRLFMGKIQGGQIRRGLLEFDFSGLPHGATAVSAELELIIYNIPPGTAQLGDASLHPVLNAWGEAGSNGSGGGASAQTGDATWLHREFDTVLWDQAGGDFDSASTSTSFNGTDTIIFFANDPDTVADINGWIQQPSLNHGWLLMGDETNNGNVRSVGSRESNDPPVLSIEYYLPADLIFTNGFEL